MSIKRIVLPKKEPNSKDQSSYTKNLSKKDPWEPLTPRVSWLGKTVGNSKPQSRPTLTLPHKPLPGFEVGSHYLCLQNFSHKYSEFYENDALKVLSNRKEPKSTSINIIFSKVENGEKKFYSFSPEEVDTVNQLFQKIT
jgi:hypothetical protein